MAPLCHITGTHHLLGYSTLPLINLLAHHLCKGESSFIPGQPGLYRWMQYVEHVQRGGVSYRCTSSVILTQSLFPPVLTDLIHLPRQMD